MTLQKFEYNFDTACSVHLITYKNYRESDNFTSELERYIKYAYINNFQIEILECFVYLYDYWKQTNYYICTTYIT